NGAICDLEARLEDLTKKLAEVALAQPKVLDDSAPGNADAAFGALVEAEMNKGCSEAVARQRVGLKYPDAAAALIAKQDKTTLEKVVDAIVEQDGVSRSVAMSRARKKEPTKFQHYQEA